MTRKSASQNSMIVAIIWGVIISLLFVILGGAIGAAIENSGNVNQTGMQWITVGIWFISAFAGVMLSLKMCKEMMCLTAGATMCGLLLILIGVKMIFWGMSYYRIGAGIVALMAGTITALLLNMRSNRSNKGKRRYKIK